MSMLRKTLPALFAVTFAVALGGCDIYFEDPDSDNDDPYTYCDDTGCYWCDEWGCYPDDGGGPGWQCDSNDDCAAGCYCDTYGYCQEAGFCSSNEDCQAGFVCDDRSSCVPGDECPEGMMGDPATGCWYACDGNEDCAAGCWCNTDTGVCEESGFCTTSADCPDGQECDDRSTCVPSDDTCASNADCGDGEVCDGELGECRAATCTEITAGNFGAGAEDLCLGNATCDAVYSGSNCTNPNNNNAPCEDGDSGCVCETFDFAACVDAPTPPPTM
jgi:hypothetical protein